MKQESFGNIRNMQRQNRLFSLVHLINSKSQGRQIINISLITASLVGNIVNFLSLKQINILKTHILVLGTVFNLIFLPLLALILLQLAIGYCYQIQFFISTQWKVFRFVIYPFLICYLLRQSFTGQFLTQTAALVLFVLTLIISLILTAAFATQSFVYKKLLHRDLPINFHLLIIQTLLYACSTLQNQNIKITCSLLLTILAYNLYNNNFAVLREGSNQFRVLCVSNFILLWCGIVLTVQLFSGISDVVSLVIASIPCLVYKVISDFTRQKSPVPYKDFASIFEDPDTIHFQVFIDSLQPIIQEIMEYYYSQNKKDFVQTLLINYYYEHSNRCPNVACPFRNQDYKYELKNMNDSKNMKDVLFKICKKIDFIYYGMYKSWPQHIDLKLSLVQFYIYCFPNKAKALQIISEIQLSKLTFQQQYELFRVKIQCQTMDILEVVGQIKLDQRLVQFENLVYLTLNTMIEFWSLFYEQKIDFNKLTAATAKMFPLRNKIQQIFQNRIKQQTFSSLQILKLYSAYSATIQNNQEKSWKIDDYLQKLRSKLEQQKQIEYLSFDSEVGLLALSLAQNKLGTIVMVNSQASNIFNYSKKQFKTIKVNEIMPKIYAQQHDNYLKVFLQNKNKKINSDQRKLLGKNKAGYVFPILLRLQRTIPSSGDQLLFIANIKMLKIRQASLTCVTDQQGQICEYTSTFDYLFFKPQIKAGKRLPKYKNIQQFIPDFFDQEIQEEQNTRYKVFKKMVNLKNYGEVEVQYTVSPVSFPLKENGGFIVWGKIIIESKPLQYPHLSMTQSLNVMMDKKLLSGHKTFYNPTHNRFQLSSEQETISHNGQFEKQYTIPFTNIDDLTNIFALKKQMINYGQGVKTIRLVENHFERVEDESQFLSEQQDQRTQSAQTINQIIDLKQSILQQKKPVFMRNIKIVLFLTTFFCIITCIVLINYYYSYSQVGKNHLHEVKHKFRTRGFLSEYIIYYTALSNGFDQQIYEQKMQRTINQLVDSIQKTSINEKKKQEIIKIVYLRNDANLTQLLNQKTISFGYKMDDLFNPIASVWCLFFAILLLTIIVSASSYFLFMKQLECVYQVLMCLQEKVINKLHSECKILAKTIQTNSHKDRASQKPQQLEQNNFKLAQQIEQDEQNPVKKVRKFKRNEKFRNLQLIFKLLFPFIFIFVLSFIIILEISKNNEYFFQQVKIHKEIFEIFPQTSVFLMNTFLKNVYGQKTLASHNFKNAYQDIDYVLFSYQIRRPGHINQSYFLTLLNNVCIRYNYTKDYARLCEQISQGTMTVGLSKAINYLANSLASLQGTPGNATLIQNFNDIIRLQYDFIFPVVQHMAELMYTRLKYQAEVFSYKFSILTIAVIILMALNFIYFLKYPACQIQEKLRLSKSLIDLLPEYYKNQKALKNKQGYEKISQQA